MNRLRGKGGRNLLTTLSFRARIFLALVGISSITSLVIGVTLYSFAQERLLESETDLLVQRSRTANAGANSFLESLRNPQDRTLPAAETYADELVRSVSAPTGLTVLYIGPQGEPLAARAASGDSVSPTETFETFGLNEEEVSDRLGSEDLKGRLIPGDEPRYVAIWPISSDGNIRGVMVYSAPQEGLEQTLAYLRYGILGAILASVLLAALGSFLLTRQITRPLSETRDAAIRVASGDYAPVRVERDDELGEVARAFNYMAEEVEHYVGEIQEQKSRLEAVLEASPEAVVATDLNERITMANPAAARMLGIRSADYGRPLEEIGTPPAVLQCLREAAKTGVAVREFEADDRNLWAYAAQMNQENEPDTSPSNGLSLESPGTILAIRDITEHRSLEKARTDFVSDVSHELRTPLTTIQSAVDLIRRARDRLDPLELRALQLAEGELQRIRSMVEELSTLAQMDSWKYSLEVGPVDIGEVVRSSVEAIESKAERFGIEVNFKDIGQHTCVCDSRKMYQVFLNLLDNAIKYSDPGAGVNVAITEDSQSVSVAIRDTGFGIPKEDLPQLFERFYRVHKDRSRATGGSGLGLAISKHIVEMHGGDIIVDSEVGVGSTFRVRVPKAPLPRSVNYAL
jgi:signal transduction histidine kinase